MSTTQQTAPRTTDDFNPSVRVATETKSSYKTSEFLAYVAAVIGVLIASAVVDGGDFGAQDAWFFVSLLTIGYMVSRGLAKSGTPAHYASNARDAFDADNR